MAKGFKHGSGSGTSSKVPEFTYTGTYKLINDPDNNWRIKFLTSGVLTFTKLNSAKDGIDLFLVGGGGGGGHASHHNGGGGGGYTKTVKNIAVGSDPITVTVGAGGAADTDGGSSGFAGHSVGGGKKGLWTHGGAGGSGGGAGAYGDKPYNGGAGGSNGGNGAGVGGEYGFGGAGQGSTTREFGESTGDLYAGGGGGCAYSSEYTPGAGGAGGGGKGGTGATYNGSNGTANTGGGGGGRGYNTMTSGKGGSGIVIIRNARG